MILKKYFTYGANDLHECFNYISILQEKYCIVKILISVHSHSNHSQLNHEFQNFFKAKLPAITIVTQAPLFGQNILLEITTVPLSTTVTYKNIGVLISEKKQFELILNGMTGYGENATESSITAFKKLSQSLTQIKWNYDHIIRQWNFIGNIISFEQYQGVEQQNYQGLNEVRELYYNKNKCNSFYPAATGIGINNKGITIDAIALNPNNSINIKSPIQIDAHVYEQKMLEGFALEGTQKKTPLFERARLCQNDEFAQLFISGTASIKGQDTIDHGDLIKQCRNTIHFIEELASLENIRSQISNFPFVRKEYVRIRVYVKNNTSSALFLELKSICEEYYPTASLSFVYADVCRESLLVEIEGDVHYY